MVKKILYKSIKEVLKTADVCNRCILRFFGIREYTSYILKTDVEKLIQQLISEDEVNNKKESVEDNTSDDYPQAKPFLPNPCAAFLENLQGTCEEMVGKLFQQFISEDEVINKKESVEDNTSDGYPQAKRFLPNPCAACLGILQGTCDEMVEKIDEVIKKSEHKFKDFVLQVSLPVVVDLRDKLFLFYLKQKLGESAGVEENIPSVKDICKWVIGSQYGKLTDSGFTPDSDFQILISSTYPDTVKECFVLFKNCPKAFPNSRKSKASAENIYTKTAILNAMDALSTEIQKLYTLPPSPPVKGCTFHDIKCTHSPLYLGGRYNKYSRELSQTPWFVDGERKMESSVNELITDVVQKRILADKIIFSASGREDVDVKMLGNGRPFVLELLNPRCLEWTVEEMKAIEEEINTGSDLIAVRDLQVISKLDTLLLKEGEELKRKTYTCVCLVKKILSPEDVIKLESLKDLQLNQKTPIRVLHRRTLATREKLIHSMQGKIISDHQLQLQVETQAGTYVKEFVHGDFGRTWPSLGTLLNTDADILELDVENIHLEWPPKPTS